MERGGGKQTCPSPLINALVPGTWVLPQKVTCDLLGKGGKKGGGLRGKGTLDRGFFYSWLWRLPLLSNLGGGKPSSQSAISISIRFHSFCHRRHPNSSPPPPKPRTALSPASLLSLARPHSSRFPPFLPVVIRSPYAESSSSFHHLN